MSPCNPSTAKSLAAVALITTSVTLLSSGFNPATAFMITANGTNVADISPVVASGFNSLTGGAQPTLTASNPARNNTTGKGQFDLPVLIEGLAVIASSVTQGGLSTIAFSPKSNTTEGKPNNDAEVVKSNFSQSADLGSLSDFEACILSGNGCNNESHPQLLLPSTSYTGTLQLTPATGLNYDLTLFPLEIKAPNSGFKGLGFASNAVPVPPQLLATVVGAGLGVLKLRRRRNSSLPSKLLN